MKKILFLNAIDPSRELQSRYPHLGFGYLASALREKHGKNAYEFKVVNRDLAKSLAEFKPDLVCLSSVTQNYDFAKGYAQIAKSFDKKLPVIIGGVHISTLPQTLDKNMDLGILWEGEETIVELAETLEGGLSPSKLKKINGLVFWDKGKLTYTGVRAPIDPLDKLPMPARDILEIDSHTYMFTSRGCPYRCVFCSSSRFWDKLRFFSAEYVVNEIKHIKETYPQVKMISFYDDLFIANKPRLQKIVQLLKEEGLNEKLAFSCSCRANLVTDEVAKLLKEMNTVSVGMGLESGNQRILTYLKGEGITVDHNRNAVKTLKKNGLAANASFVIGSPDETREEILETLEFIKEINLGFVDTYVLTPLPGTPVWEYAKKRGLVSDDMDWGRLDVSFAENHEKAIILSETLSREELLSLYRKFQSLRYRTMLKNAPKHPFALDIPKILSKIILLKIRYALNPPKVG
ncbi:MAG: radical SAM protein [Candidatus Micrarchaeota archaeon]